MIERVGVTIVNVCQYIIVDGHRLKHVLTQTVSSYKHLCIVI